MSVRFIDFPPEMARFRIIANKAFEEWAPGSEVSFRRLKQGYSGSAVVRADVRPEGGAAGVESGEYIVKLSGHPKWDDLESEDVCHQRAQQFDVEFAQQHIPRLREIKHVDAITPDDISAVSREMDDPTKPAETLPPYIPGFAALYEIAGGSLARFAPLDRLDADYFSNVAELISTDLASHWAYPNPRRQLTVAELLVDWLGYRLDPTMGKNLQAFISNQTNSSGDYSFGNRRLIDPLRFYAVCDNELPEKMYVIDGLSHGDLHKGNILLHQRDPVTNPYWVIDFALSRLAPFGFDHAYLEVSSIVDLASGMPPIDFLEFLDAIFRNENVFSLHSAPVRQLGGCIFGIRKGLETWSKTFQRHRGDHISQQLQIARIAAGLNWVNKTGLDSSKRLAALSYSSLAVDYFLREHRRSSYTKVWEVSTQQMPNTDGISQNTNVISPGDQDLWKELVAACHHFDVSSYRYALVADTLPTAWIPRALGPGPWSAVIDLDPKSDRSGLHHHVAPTLEQIRGIHIFDDEIPSVDLRRGTAWMMAGGWEIKRKLFKDDQEWRYKQLKFVQRFCEYIVQNTSPNPLFVFVVGPDIEKSYKVKRIIEALDDASLGEAYFILLGGANAADINVKNKIEIPLAVPTFMRLLERNTIGALFSDEPELPTSDGRRIAIPYEKLRVIEENLVVLHSRILLDEGSQEPIAGSAFWRGRPPSWRELDAGMDVTRAVHAELLEILRQKLESYSTETQLLYHTPGSGGTTVAHRVAWDLHGEYPTVVLRTNTRGLADRIRELYQLTQKPVLVVAESAVLTENSREDLYRSLRQSNCRAVILYVRKTIASKKGGVGLVVADPMSSGECELFEKSYSSLVIDEAIKLKLRQVSTNDDFDRYRIPFFFGLIAFEREFETVDRFVNSYLQRVRGRAREAIELLAFVTLFSDHGFSKALVAKIAGLSSTTDASIEILLGEGAARLLIEREAGFRIMHQRIAEEVLNWAYSTARDGWQRHLQQLAIQFIEMVCREAGNNSEFTLATLREIFIDRIGGDVDDVKDRQKFAPVIELLDNLVGPAHGHQIFLKLTEECPEHAHFWMHRGRHHIYRLRGDATVAEGYLERAVSLSPLDPIMHHAYGLVLRYRIREMIRTSRDMDARELLDSILPHYRKASDEFRIARELDPENMHGYVTHIQLNINVCGAIKKLVAIQSVAQIRFTPYQDLAEFVEQAMVEAQTLLRDVSGLYGTLTASQSRYVVTCSKSIRVLYNDYDEAIRLLERADAALGGAYIRRSLANAYLSRRQRHWSELSTAEIRRVTNLMKKNLDAPGRQDDDYRLWFEGYRLLPEFDPVTALDRLSVWSVESASWRPYYYLFVLNFMRWLNHEIISLDEMDAAVAKSKERLIGRRTISDFWLGKRGSRWVLIHESELGEWDKDNKDRYKRFWKDPSRLHRKNGQIDRRIDGPQAANIWIEGRAKAFFVPGKSFSANRDENKLVNFYLGFNPEGLRAWSVEHGHVHGGNRTEEVIPTVADAAFEHDQLPEADKLDRARVLQKARVLSFVQDIIVSAASEDVRLELNDISMRVDACFGIPDIYKVIGFSDKGDLVSGNPKFYVESSEVGTLVGLNPSQEEDAAGLSLQQCLPGYIDQVYDAVQTARIRALDNRMYVALFDVFQAEQRDSIQSMVPVEIALVSRKGRTSVTGVKIVEDRIYVSDRGLLDVGELTNALCDRFRKFSAAQFSEPQFLRGIVPLERCYQLLGVSKFGELLAKVGAEVRREAKLEVAAQRKAQSEARARRNAQAEAEALGADVTRMSSSVREGRGGKQVATAVAEAVGVRKHGKVKRFVKNRQSTIETELYRTIGDVIDKFNQGKGISLPRLGQDLIDADPQWKEKLKKLNRSKLRPFVEKNGQFEIFEEGSTAYVRRRPGATE